MRQKNFFQILGPAVFFLMLWIGPPSDMSEPAFRVMAATIWIAIWWMTEAIPVPVTSFLPMILYPLTNSVPLRVIAPSYANPIIYIFVAILGISLLIFSFKVYCQQKKPLTMKNIYLVCVENCLAVFFQFSKKQFFEIC